MCAMQDPTNIKTCDMHSVCIPCLRCYLSYLEGGVLKHLNSIGEEIKRNCPKKTCGKKFDVKNYFKILTKEEAAILLAEWKSFKKPINPQNKDINKSVIKEAELYCPVCQKIIGKQNLTKMAPCKHIVHTQCMIEIIKDLPSTKSIHDVFCETCGKPYDYREIEKLIKNEEGGEQKIAELKGNYTLKADFLKCACCGQAVKFEGNSYPGQLKCSICQEDVCRLCKNLKHEGTCYPRKALIKDWLERPENAGRSIIPCPVCMQLNVIISQESLAVCVLCNSTFCSFCGANQTIIDFHGSSYHRPSCPEGKKSFSGIISQNCPLCIKNAAFCPKTLNLDEGELPVSEIPKGIIQP